MGNVKQKLTWDLDPQTAPAVRQAFDAYFVGKGGKQIADDLARMGYRSRRGRPMDKSTILTWFRVPFRFAGCIVYGHKNKHQSYRPREEWQPDCYPAAIITMEETEKLARNVIWRGNFGA